MRLGGPIFRKVNTFEEEVALHRKLGFGAAFCKYIQDPSKREEYKQAYAEADIVLAEYGADGINILDTDPTLRQQNIDEICRRLAYADEMGARCCVIHGGTVETGDSGNANPLNMSEKSFAESVAIVQAILDRVKPTTTKLVMETESYLLPDSPEVYLRLIEAIDRPVLRCILIPLTSPPARGDFTTMPCLSNSALPIGKSLDRELSCERHEYAAKASDRAH